MCTGGENRAYTAQGRLREAINLALEVLTLAGIELLKPLMEAKVVTALRQTHTALAGRSFEESLQLSGHDRP